MGGDVDLFAGLSGPSPVPVGAVDRRSPREPSLQGGEKPWPPVKDGGYCEPHGEEWGIEPEGRWMTCLEPGADCTERAVPSCARCAEHLRPRDVLDYADSYAIASILYYSGDAPENFMTDGQFDGICSFLLAARAWRVVPWLEKNMLKAGSGYDLERFPLELHEAARQWKESIG